MSGEKARFARPKKSKIDSKYSLFSEDKKEKYRERTRKYRAANPEKVRTQWRSYRMRKMIAAGATPKPEFCEVCGGNEVRICADHIHQSGKFRGWLCNRCNLILGKAKDAPELLRLLAAYLEARANG